MTHCSSPPLSHQTLQPVSVQQLQTELRSLCVSSPPSLQASPIHGVLCPSSSCNPSQSPPLTGNPLQIISEENIVSSHQCVSSRDAKTTSPSSLPTSPLPFLGLTFTPPHSFRTCSPEAHMTCSQTNTAPAISVTDELGAAHFPILPPPHAFAHFSQPNLQPSSRTRQEEIQEAPASDEDGDPASFSNLYRWKDGKAVPGVTACGRWWYFHRSALRSPVLLSLPLSLSSVLFQQPIPVKKKTDLSFISNNSWIIFQL